MHKSSSEGSSRGSRRGLYDARFEHDACGIGFVAQVSGTPSHAIIEMALTALSNVAHRGGISADGMSGDGAGVLTQVPRPFFERELQRLGISYPLDALAVGMVFLPRDSGRAAFARGLVECGLAQHGLQTLGWRKVPLDHAALGMRAGESCPAIEQVMVGCASNMRNKSDAPDNSERVLYLARKTIEAAVTAAGVEGFSIPSLSTRTLVYKGLLVASMLGHFYPDLRDPLYSVAFAIYHQRYSTNTFPTWERAQPFRMLSHNGEINTLGGNIAWMRAREAAWREDELRIDDEGRRTKDDSSRSAHRPATDSRRSSVISNPQSAIRSQLSRKAPAPCADGMRQTEGHEHIRNPQLTGSELARQIAATGPIVDLSGSDSAMLDNVLELAVMGGRDIRHAIATMVPEAWEGVRDIAPDLRSFYEYHSGLMEPWDGPAALAFSDGRVVGLALDRNGLRPARYLFTDDGLVLCGSEAGVVPVDETRIVRKGKLGPGQMIAVDLHTGEFLENEAIKRSLAAANPYGEWVKSCIRTPDLDAGAHETTPEEMPITAIEELQRAFGYTSEELTVIVRPMLEDGREPVGSMGDDTAVAFMANRARPLYAYIKQRFAEVTNPPIDPLREQMVMSLSVFIGNKGDLLAKEPGKTQLLKLPSPVLSDRQLVSILAFRDATFRSATLCALFNPDTGPDGLQNKLEQLCAAAEEAVEAGAHLLVISDRGVSESCAAVPMLLAVGAVHNHLINKGLRRKAGIIVESGEPREVHHTACLVGMGAEAVNPYLALATARHIAQERAEIQRRKAVTEHQPIERLVPPAVGGPRGTPPILQVPSERHGARNSALGSIQEEHAEAITPGQAEENYIHAMEKGLLKVMSKMGISTISSYCGAQVFEAIGLSDEVIERCFPGLPARLGGVGLEWLAADAIEQHSAVFGKAGSNLRASSLAALTNPGYYKYKKDGEYHTYSPAVVHALQKAVHGDGDYAAYRTYSDLVHSRPPVELRDLLDFVPGEPVPVNEVEPVEAIVTRFSSAAMSLGSTSSEAHETIAIAMNRLGGLSNSGEGGEDPARFGNERNSPIKQVASARFGVTPAYLVSAQELQIKMAQGSKPGEGGQLPAHKVSEEIARIRHSAPGIELVSPPPHHDIYSIEDLAQLIYDLKQVKPGVDISVKLVAEAGVGTVAAGVAKGGADIILISGNSGGTGASPLSSIKNAGVNWELGLAEAHQTLVMNGLRGRVRLRADGGLKTGRDVVIAAMLGADEFSFGTAVLVAEGCLMARTCHSNNCPVGIATQRPELRAKFTGTPEQVIHFFLNVAQEIREILASLGARSLRDITGRSDMLRQMKRTDALQCVSTHEADMFDLSAMIARVDGPGDAIRAEEAGGNVAGCQANATLNNRLLEDCGEALEHLRKTDLSYSITNRDRTVGATLAGAIAARYGDAGLPAGTIAARFEGSAGQSFGAFLVPGIHFLLQGEANDYVCKGMAGGEVAVYPPTNARYASHLSALLGNTVLYGATGGALYAAGMAGERFAVRNSGAISVVEGVGDHGCEYMTGGVVVVIGRTGRNFAAGMTGGLAYLFDQDGSFGQRCNQDTVTLESLEPEDEDILVALLVRHLQLTGSRRAHELLLGWDSVRDRFLRVQPRGAGIVRLPHLMVSRHGHPQESVIASGVLR